ncbi:hypothetical protein NPIL_157921 [Nephila pilipes]|uniref:Uncharacterized protein n=1 Tax=Nephila pilipes TaxID=299642 RepID=A0A8X6ULA7_NEPPI|nr:hypothetical protein NPIL_157921 [Nephila pilipes]
MVISVDVLLGRPQGKDIDRHSSIMGGNHSKGVGQYLYSYLPDSTEPVDLLVERPFLDLAYIAYIKVVEELQFGYVKDYPFLNLISVKVTSRIESKAAETARSKLIKVKEENKK